MAEDLQNTQAFLIEAIKGMEPIASHPKLAGLAPKFVTGNARLRPVDQVDIYRRQFWYRHREILGDDFPGVERVLGKELMDAVCRAYLIAFPPAVVSFRAMAEHLPAFIETFPDLSPNQRLFAVEMARYEIAMFDHRIGANVPPLDPQKLASLPEDAWEKARIVLHPLLRLFALSYPVHRIRRAWLRGDPITVAETPAEAPIHIALYRTAEIITHFEELAPEAFAVLSALAAGMPLVPALDLVASSLSEERQAFVMANVGAWFQVWTQRGFVVDVELP